MPTRVDYGREREAAGINIVRFLDRLRASRAALGQPQSQTEAIRLRRGSRVHVVGESYYQDALDRICGGKTSEGHQHLCLAVLIAEPGNPYDANAIAVYVDDLKVGHLSRQDAVAYKSVMSHLAASNRVGTCTALVVGGWRRDGGDEGHFGVQLDLAPPDAALPDD